MSAIEGLPKAGLQKLTRRAKGVASRVLLHRFLPARLVLAVVPYQERHMTGADCDRQYSSGRWDYLREAPEMGRYSVIAGYCRYYGPLDRVLDIGCGEGLLADWLGPVGVGSYVGIDLSEHGIAAARERGLPKAEFSVAKAEEFEPEGRFSGIIFNEVLYFLADPVGQLKRFSEALEPGGVFIVSLYESIHSLRLWPLLGREFKTLDKVHIRHATKTAWDVAVLRPR